MHIILLWAVSAASYLQHLEDMGLECQLPVLVSRATCGVQTVSERLSQHVLNNYSKFVAGVTEVASVERDLQVI